MTLSASVEKKVNQILNVFETGKLEGDPSNVTIFKDGLKSLRADRKQISYGKKQTTESYGLRGLIQLYCNMKGAKYASYFKQKLSIIGRVSLVDNETFIDMLKKAGTDPVMSKAQDMFFENEYGQRAKAFFLKNEFTLPLSYAVIFDSIIHSGQIRDDIRNMFTEKPPSKGGDEREWIFQYALARKKWLISKGIPLSKTIYRMDSFLDAMRDNWYLEKPFIANGVKID